MTKDKLAWVMNNLKRNKSPRDVSWRQLSRPDSRLGYDRGEKVQHPLQEILKTSISKAHRIPQFVSLNLSTFIQHDETIARRSPFISMSAMAPANMFSQYKNELSSRAFLCVTINKKPGKVNVAVLYVQGPGYFQNAKLFRLFLVAT